MLQLTKTERYLQTINHRPTLFVMFVLIVLLEKFRENEKRFRENIREKLWYYIYQRLRSGREVCEGHTGHA